MQLVEAMCALVACSLFGIIAQVEVVCQGEKTNFISSLKRGFSTSDDSYKYL